MDTETIATLAALIPVAVKFLHSQGRLTQVAEHAVKQNTEILGRQTAILDRLSVLCETLALRVEALEEAGEGEDTVVVGFRAEGEEDEAEEEDAEEEPLQNGGHLPKKARTSRR